MLPLAGVTQGAQLMNPARKRFVETTQWYRTRRAARVAHASYLVGTVPRQHSTRPVIVVGMHRSGTSVTAEVLSALGVSMGGDVTDRTHESLVYRCRNEALLAVTGASWDHPRPFVRAIADDDWRRALASTLDATIESPWKWLLTDPHRGSRHEPGRWGWKDPRTSITWPLWLDLYPGACFVRVRRRPNEVVASLIARSRRSNPAQLSIRATTEDGAATLVDEYVSSLAELDATVPEQVVDVDYDELTYAPRATVARLAFELGLDPGRVDAAAAVVRPRRS